MEVRTVERRVLRLTRCLIASRSGSSREASRAYCNVNCFFGAAQVVERTVYETGYFNHSFEPVNPKFSAYFDTHGYLYEIIYFLRYCDDRTSASHQSFFRIKISGVILWCDRSKRLSLDRLRRNLSVHPRLHAAHM